MKTFEEILEERKKRKQKGTQTSVSNSSTRKSFDDILAERGIVREKNTTSAVGVSAPTTTEDSTWFQKSALFDDGYDKGDVSKAILGSGTDVAENAGAGFLGIGEMFVDALAWLASAMSGVEKQTAANNEIFYNGLAGNGVDATKTLESYNAVQSQVEKASEEFIEKDLYDEQAIAKKATTDFVKEKTGVDAETDSVFGEKSDELAQSAGQLGATVLANAIAPGSGLALTGITAFGGEMESALNQGATYDEAAFSAAVSAGAEVLTEKLTGGIKLGGKALDDAITSKITSRISSSVARKLMDLGMDAAGEGFEEILSGAMSAAGQKLSYMSDKEMNELFSAQDAWDSFVGGAVLGGFSGAGKNIKAKIKGVDSVTGLTKNEQAVFDKIYKDRVNEAKKGGKRLSGKDKENIYNSVMNDIEKGYIGISDIESVLGGETYKQYQSAVEEDNRMKELQSEYDTLYKMKNGEKSDEQIDRQKEIKQQLEEYKTNSKLSDIQKQLSNEVSKLAKTSRLAESYNEKSRRSQTFEADLTQYDEAHQGTYKRAMESGVLNNTNRTHEFVDLIAKLEADKGVLFDFTDNAKIKETGFAIEGKQVNGYVQGNNIAINIDSTSALNKVVGHEITHVLEGTQLYTELANAVKEFATAKGEYDSKLQSIAEVYEDMENVNLENELTADLIGEYLFTDSEFVKRLSVEKPTLFQKIFDEIKYLCKVATAGSKEARQLEKVKKTFEDAYRQKNNTATDDGVKYSMAGVNSKTHDFSLLEQAIRLEDVGKATSEEIRQQTGWFRGYDGEWRYEIDDSKCELIENPNLEKHSDEFVGTYFTGKVSDILNHNELFESYPQLKDIEVVIQPTKEGLRGRYEGGSAKNIVLNIELFKRLTKEYDDIVRNSAAEIKEIEQTPEYKEYNKWHEDDDLLNMDAEEWLIEEDKAREKFYSSELGKRYYYLKWGRKDIQTHEFGWSKSAKEVLMHELQHAVQEIEGFTSGSSDEYWQSKLNSGFTIKSAEQKEDLKNTEKEYRAIMKKDPYFFSAMEELVKSKPDLPRGKVNWDTFEQIEEDPIEWQRFDANREMLEKEYGSEAVMHFFRVSDKLKNLREISYTAEQAYFKTAGEVEARDTAQRLNLNAEQRKNTRPDIDRTNVVFADDSNVSSSIEYTEDNKPVVIVENDVLDGIPKSQWIDTVKNTISSKFSQGIPISGKLIKVNLITRKEFTNSKTTQHYRRYEKQIYKDKFKSANNLDEIVLASTNYVNEDLKHERNDNFTEFARGDVLMRIGNNDYSAKVVVGFTSGQQMVLYDIVDFTNTRFNIKKVDTHTAQVQNAQSSRTSVSTNNIISTPTENVKKKQLEIINKHNPAPNTYNTWVRSVDDIKTFEEALADDEYADYDEFNPDFDRAMAEQAIKDGEITVYSSYPIEQGVFVSPSYMEAESYSGDGNVYSKRVPLDSVAWIDITQGQYADTKTDNKKYSLSNTNDDIAPVGNNNVYGEDIKLQRASAEDIAPTAEDIKKQNTLVIDDAPIKDGYSTHNDLVNQMSDIMDENATEEYVNEKFNSQFDSWDKKTTGFSFVVGKTSKALIDAGIPNQQIRWDASKLKTTLEKHKGMSAKVIKQVPNLLENPIVVIDSKSDIQSKIVLGELYDDNGKIVTVVLKLNPTSKKGNELNLIKISSTQGRGHIESLFKYENGNDVAVRYVDKKRIQSWLNVNRLQLPLHSFNLDSNNIISNTEQNVNENVPDYFLDSEDKQETKLTRKALHSNIIEGFKSAFKKEGLDFKTELEKGKRHGEIFHDDNTPQRIMEKTFGHKAGQLLADLTVNKIAQNETEAIKWLNSYTGKKGLFRKFSKEYHIKPGSKESAAAQMYLEGFYVNESDEYVRYGDAELAADFPDRNVRENIRLFAKDPRVREFYDSSLNAINEARVRNAYEPIPRRDNYALHFRAMDDVFSKIGVPLNPNDIKAKDLPTDLNGITVDLKPGQPYFASAKHRVGVKTTYDLLGGMERYANSAKNQIYHIDDIQNLRALRNYIADSFGQAKGLEGIDEMSASEAKERIELVYNGHLSNFAKWLNEEANHVAGKTALIDRAIPRRALQVLNNINGMVGSNQVGFNFSSSLTNVIPVVQTFARTNKFDFAKAFSQTVLNTVRRFSGNDDGFAEKSPVMIRRKGAESFARTPYQKIADTGYVLMSAVDGVATELIARTKFNEYTRKGMDEQKAHFETDKWVSKLMGDRSLGQQPLLYNSKTFGLFTKYQLEVRNQLDSMFYDTFQETKEKYENIESNLEKNAKTAAKYTATLLELAVAQYIFGTAFEAMAGYNPAFDIIEVILTACGTDDEEDSEDDVLDNLEQAFLELLGDMPYSNLYTGGGRIPISSALPIKEIIEGKDQYGNDKSRAETIRDALPYYILPTGYGQVKKTTQGLSMFNDVRELIPDPIRNFTADVRRDLSSARDTTDSSVEKKILNEAVNIIPNLDDVPISGSYTDSGKLRFTVDETLDEMVKAGLFGQYASKNARQYFDEERAPLSDKQTQELIDLDIPIADYWKYRDGLKDLGEDAKLKEKVAYIADLEGLSTEQKNIMANNLTDRKDPIDLTDYDKYGDLDELDYAVKYPGKYAVSKAVGGYNEYIEYSEHLNNITAEKNSKGETVSGSRKIKVARYINNLDIDYGEKIILYKSQYPGDDTYNSEIVDYLNSRDDISRKEMETILKELGFEVYADGTVRW